MSKFSGKCDLYDHIAMEKMYDKGSCRVSDELECFDIFKQKTGGVIYQYHCVPVTDYNQDYIKELCPQFDYTVETQRKPDRRKASGYKTVTTYTYSYWGTTYNTLKELNQKKVYVRIPIRFETLLDIIPYYPYIVTSAACDHDKEVIVISNESFIDTTMKDGLRYGRYGEGIDITNLYKQRLQEHYFDVCKNYYLYKYDERVRVEPIVVDPKTGIGTTQEEIDPLHGVEYVWKNNVAQAHWSSPRFIDKNQYQLHINDIQHHLAEAIKNNDVQIKYVARVELPKVMG